MSGTKAPSRSRLSRQVVFCSTAIFVLASGLAWLKPADPQATGTPPPRSLPEPAPIIGANSTDPQVFKPLSQEEAARENEVIPIAKSVNPPARPFRLVSASPQDYPRALECLSQALYFETRGEGADGERAVAQVVLNRVRHPAFPKTVCGVIYEGESRATGCQFTFTCQHIDLDVTEARARQEALKIAARALSGDVYRPVGLSTHYHADSVVPYWAAALIKTAVVGRHIFYRWTGWADPRFFRAAYAGHEPDEVRAFIGGTVDPAKVDGAAELASRSPIPAVPIKPPATADTARTPLAADRTASKLLADEGRDAKDKFPTGKAGQAKKTEGSETTKPSCAPFKPSDHRATAIASLAPPAGAVQPMCQ